MRFDFDKATERRGTNSLKWDVGEGELPMWVADMDFEAAPEIKEAILRRAEHGIFGYSIVPEEWYQAYQSWWQRRHGFTINRDWLMFCTGVVPAISSIVRKLTTPAEKVVVQTPVYNIFFNSIENNGRQVLPCPLAYEGGMYRVDFEALERCLADPQASLMLLCNPHNPVGKVWDAETLGRIGELCKQYHVTVIADEIHCDLTDPGVQYTPFASVSGTCREISVTCLAPTKAFNLAGLQTAAIAAPDECLRHKVWRAINTDEAAEPNAFAVEAAVAAFTKGEEWLDGLREYVFQNKRLVEEFIAREIPALHVVPSQATYLLWLDCRNMVGNAWEAARLIRRETGLYLSAGSQYGENGRDFLRMNIGCQRERVEDGLARLKRGIAAYEAFVLERC